MSDERRFDEGEVAEIFRRATEGGEARGVGPGAGEGGLTLGELREIGEEVGIPGASIARAAAGLDRAPRSDRTALGLPTGVSRTIDLPRDLTDGEWERLVILLRRTFDAEGRVHASGRLREWTNGNLQVLVEPSESGDQLRLRTHKGNLRPMLSMAFTFLAVAVVLAVIPAVSGSETELGAALFLALAGLGTAGSVLADLPRWARRRAERMEEIAATAADWTSRPPAKT